MKRNRRFRVRVVFPVIVVALLSGLSTADSARAEKGVILIYPGSSGQHRDCATAYNDCIGSPPIYPTPEEVATAAILDSYLSEDEQYELNIDPAIVDPVAQHEQEVAQHEANKAACWESYNTCMEEC